MMDIHRNSHIAAFMLAEEVSIDFCKDLTLSEQSDMYIEVGD